ncbi:hypothetical protein [Nitrosomonas aestuarii]|uniref:hypothetical protein n=1 Tax=Nitrosomonas aestuarii TaxID=52441 RepID=UPI000D325DF5|nr:hypothetical protein [Nitrosomonas aestuarii]PTN10769.1 hypothetical protein C8R11_11812 [Nitrosomonas aestuarii]
MARKGKKNFGRVNNDIQVKKGIIKADSQPTEPQKDDEKEEYKNYRTAERSKVPAETPFSKEIINWLSKWSPLAGWIIIISAVIAAYYSFNNNIENAKKDINNLYEGSINNKKSIHNIEKELVKIDTDNKHMDSRLINLGDKVNEVNSNLKQIEIEHVKQKLMLKQNRD